jgi:hypothetical protein
MFYPQGNFYSQGNLGYPQGGVGFPHVGFPQGGVGYPQGGVGSPQGGFGHPQGVLGQQSFQATPNAIPFANTLYGYPQPTPYFAQGLTQIPPQVSNWQHLAQQQAALQQQALLQLLAPQLAAQSLAPQHPAGITGNTGISGLHSGIANGAGQPVGGWQQLQPNPEQINPAVLQQQQLLQQPQHQLQRLAQYHYLVAQQFAQLAAQQAAQQIGSPYGGQFIPGTGQFIPGQLGPNFVPGITMH